MGQFLLHRVGFFQFVPSGVRALGLSGGGERLAAARGDGSLEIVSLRSSGQARQVIPGNEKRSIEAISWIGENRLLTVGLNGEITEFDLQRLCPKYTLDAFGGPLWCMSCNYEETHLAVGCEDGSVKLFEIVPDKIQFERSLDRQKGRVLSLAWHKSGMMIVTGSLDVIRVFDVKSGHSTRRILVDRGGTALHNWECVVWSVCFLSDYTIVSADSAGKVQFWDWRTGTLLKTHPITKCDVLTLAVNDAEDSIVAGTSEGTVVQFQLLIVKSGVSDAQWVRTKTFKHHSHDVRAVVHTKTALISGGLDAQLVIRPLMDLVETKSYEAALRKILFPHRSLVCCSRKANLLVFQFPEHLELWRLGSPGATGNPGDILPISKKPVKLLQLKNKGCDHIRCCALSLCGTWIAFSTIYRVRLYRLQYENDSVTVNAASRFVKTLQPAHQLLFSADSAQLFVASDYNRIQIVDLVTLNSKRTHILTSKSGSLEAVHLLAASADGNWLAAANYGCEISIYNLKQLKHYCTVPVYNQLPTAIAINPQTNNLITVHADHQIFEFSISEKRYTEWSRALQQRGLHPNWVERDTPVTHVTFNPKVSTQFIIHDTYMFCIIDQLLRFPTGQSNLHNQEVLRGLSGKARKAQEHAFKICKKFKPLLFVDLLSDGCLVVVERPVMEINAQLPAPVRQKKFAT